MNKLMKLTNRASAAHERWGQIRRERSDLVRRQEGLRDEADEFDRESAAFALLPEHERPHVRAVLGEVYASSTAKTAQRRLEQLAKSLARWLDYYYSFSWQMVCFSPGHNARFEAEMTAALAEEINLEIEREVFDEIYK